MSTLSERIAENLRLLIRDMQITDKAFAIRAEMTPGHLSDVLNLKRKLSLDAVERIARNFKIDPSVLVCQPPPVGLSHHQRAEKELQSQLSQAQDADTSSAGSLHERFAEEAFIAAIDDRLAAFATIARELHATRDQLQVAVAHVETIVDDFHEQAAALASAPDSGKRVVASTLEAGQPAATGKLHGKAGGKTHRPAK